MRPFIKYAPSGYTEATHCHIHQHVDPSVFLLNKISRLCVPAQRFVYVNKLKEINTSYVSPTNQMSRLHNPEIMESIS